MLKVSVCEAFWLMGFFFHRNMKTHYLVLKRKKMLASTSLWSGRKWAVGWADLSAGRLDFHNLCFCHWNLRFFHLLNLDVNKETNFAVGNYLRGELVTCYFVREISAYSRCIFYPLVSINAQLTEICNPKCIVLIKSVWSNIKILYMLLFTAKTIEDTSAEVFFWIL